MLSEAAAGASGGLDALWPALAAIAVALIGLVGNLIVRRRDHDDEPEDTNLITALATALAAAEARASAEARRADQCEARENARRHR